MRRTGRVPTIADFEKVMVVAHMQRFSIVQAEHHVAANPTAAASAMADMSVRCPLQPALSPRRHGPPLMLPRAFLSNTEQERPPSLSAGAPALNLRPKP